MLNELNILERDFPALFQQKWYGDEDFIYTSHKGKTIYLTSGHKHLPKMKAAFVKVIVGSPVLIVNERINDFVQVNTYEISADIGSFFSFLNKNETQISVDWQNIPGCVLVVSCKEQEISKYNPVDSDNPLLQICREIYEPKITKEQPKFSWRIGHDNVEKCVLIDFEQPTSWMLLKPEEAEKAGNRLLHHARKARGF